MDSHQRGTFRPCELNTWELHTRGYVQSVHRDLAVLMMPQGHLTRGHFGVDVDQLYLLPASEDTSGLNGGFGVIKWNCQTPELFYVHKCPTMFGYSTALEEFVYVVCYEYSDVEK